MGSVDASRSCASNPGRRFGIGRLVVEECIVLYVACCMDHSCGRLGRVTLRVPMCAIDSMRLDLSVRTLVNLLQSEILLQSRCNPSFWVEYS
eukprot:scaffold163249_cov51-Attheya_sp.AAC.2